MDFRGQFEWGNLFMPFLLTKFLEKGKILQLLSINRGNPSKHELKLVFKMLKLVFKTPKLPCPAFSLQGLGWIPHKIKPVLMTHFGSCEFAQNPKFIDPSDGFQLRGLLLEVRAIGTLGTLLCNVLLLPKYDMMK